MLVVFYLKYKNASYVARLIFLVIIGGVFASILFLAIFFSAIRNNLTDYISQDTAVYIRINVPKFRSDQPIKKLATNLLTSITGRSFSDLPFNYIDRELAVLINFNGDYTILIKSSDYVGLNQYLDKSGIKYLSCQSNLTVISDVLTNCPYKNHSDFTKEIRKSFSFFDSLNVYTQNWSLRGVVKKDKLLISDVGSKPAQIEYGDDYDFVFSSSGLERKSLFSYSGIIMIDNYLKEFDIEPKKLKSFFVGIKKTDRDGGFLTGNDFLISVSGDDEQIERVEGLILFELAKENPVYQKRQLTDGTNISEVFADPSIFEFDDDRAVISNDLSLFKKKEGDVWVLTNNEAWLDRDIAFDNKLYINKIKLPELNLWEALNSFDYVILDDSGLNLY